MNYRYKVYGRCKNTELLKNIGDIWCENSKSEYVVYRMTYKVTPSNDM